ncbi:MAG: PQQ-binding-like beta-propeller repeat protein, partial [Planctomycetota bacterium]|nr:PQQ-binding-like beta-propeller repeat protein [Planctomycetota bacterium]
SYDVVRMPRAMLHGQADRQVYFSNNAPVLADGVVCMTPLDSQFALGMDAESGDVLWRLPYDARIGAAENRVQWLCGAIDDEFILSGAGVVAAKARPEVGLDARAVVRQLIHPDQMGDRRQTLMPARPAVTSQHVYVPTVDRVLAFDRSGAPHAARPIIELNGYQPGNLMLVDGVLCSVRSRAFELALDARALLERSTTRVQAAPNNPSALLQLALLQRALIGADATWAQAAAIQALFKRGLQACIDQGMQPTHPTRQALQRELFDQALTVAQAAIDARARDALSLLTEARDLAPRDEDWIKVQTQVLAVSQSDTARFLDELDRLQRRAPGGVMPAPMRMNVSTFVLWQRAIAAQEEPAKAALLWQQLLLEEGDAAIGADAARQVAEQAIEALIGQHGRSIYARIEDRAASALRAARDDAAALRRVTRDYPNSVAAARAGLTLLDRAVEDGDLGAAAVVMARAARADQLTPSVMRRVQVAAIRRGNLPLARAMATRLERGPDQPSDWDADGSRSFAAASRAAMAAAAPHTQNVRTALPSRELAEIRPRTRQEYIRMLPTRTAPGFHRPTDAPIYAVAGSDLAAFDVASGAATPLFRAPVEFLEHLIICGDALIVPDMERLFAVHYRSGELLWELAFEQPPLLESLGVTRGVLHVSAQPAVPDGNSELIGIEPLTGTRLFQRAMDESRLKPKPTEGHLLSMSVDADGVWIERLDPLTGQTVTRVNCRAATGPDLLSLRADSLATRLYPQGISGDDQRVYLPVEGRRQQETRPQLLAVDNDGQLVWRWRGTEGMSLIMSQRRGDRVVVAESSEQRTGRMILLDAKTGDQLREVDIGFDAAILNWERSWLHNPAPAIVAVGSEIDRQEHQRQLVCFSTDEQAPFAVPLRPTDGDVEREPQFGDGFVTFGVRPRRAGSPFRLYAVDLSTRRGAFAGSTRDRPVRSRGVPHGMAGAGPYTVLSTTQGLIVLGDTDDENR